jgi:hypothetical protein
MSNVIEFLERMGQDARLRHASRNTVESALLSAKIDADVRTAILTDDHRQLESLLGANPKMCCLIEPGSHGDEDPQYAS